MKKQVEVPKTKQGPTLGDKTRRWIKGLITQLFDIVAVVVVLSLAVRGAITFIDNASPEVRLGGAIIVVGVFSARLIERIFPTK